MENVVDHRFEFCRWGTVEGVGPITQWKAERRIFCEPPANPGSSRYRQACDVMLRAHKHVVKLGFGFLNVDKDEPDEMSRMTSTVHETRQMNFEMNWLKGEWSWD